MNRNEFLLKKPAREYKKYKRDLAAYRSAWQDVIYLKVAEQKAEDGKEKLIEFAEKMEKIIAKMGDFQLLPEGEMDDLDHTFEFDKAFERVTFWVYPLPDDGNKQFKITMYVVDILALSPKDVQKEIRAQVK